MSQGGSLRDRLDFSNSARGSQPAGSGGGGGGGRPFRPYRRGSGASTRARYARGRADPKYADSHPRSHLDHFQDDDRMESSEKKSKSSRYVPYKRGAYRGRRGRGGFSNTRGQSGGSYQDSSKWSKVMLYNCKALGKDRLLHELEINGATQLNAVQFHWLGDSASFFVEGPEIVRKLKDCHQAITLPDGSKMKLNIRPSAPPKRHTNDDRAGTDTHRTSSDPDLEPILQECMAAAFDMSSQVLSLKDIGNNTVLKQKGIRGAFYHHQFTSAVFKLIQTLCPTLKGLDLSFNKIRHLKALKDIGTAAPNLEHLSLGNNELSDIAELHLLAKLGNLKTLILEGNPMVKNFAGQPLAYVSEVRKHVPQIETVDGQKLPPPIAFDEPASLPLPVSKDNYLVDNSMQTAISQFLQSYMEVFDSDNRQRLLDVYDDNAIFSMCVNTNVRGTDSNDSRTSSLSPYFGCSRNMTRISEPSKRAFLLKMTKSATVAALTSDFQKTKHDLASFNIDLVLAQSSAMCFTVRGRFVEVDTNTLRAFTRTFVVIPNSNTSGLLIVNDQLQIRNVIAKDAIYAATKANMASSSQSSVAAAATPTHNQLVLRFSEESKMNAAFSRQCLVDNGWDYQRAAVVFTNLQSTGKIPPEAFVT